MYLGQADIVMSLEALPRGTARSETLAMSTVEPALGSRTSV